jgi:hypothetical protein
VLDATSENGRPRLFFDDKPAAAADFHQEGFPGLDSDKPSLSTASIRTFILTSTHRWLESRL